MELEVSFGEESITLNVENPFRLDPEEIGWKIRHFAEEKGLSLEGLDIEGLLPRMVKGVYGCEEGCPADAKKLVTEGHTGFWLEYIEGGILKAVAEGTEPVFSIKVFPEF